MIFQPNLIISWLRERELGDRSICIRWWTLGDMSYGGFRLRDNLNVMVSPLNFLVSPQSDRFFKVLRRGTTYETRRVQISVDFNSSAWH